jgi:hypothetical protein
MTNDRNGSARDFVNEHVRRMPLTRSQLQGGSLSIVNNFLDCAYFPGTTEL